MKAVIVILVALLVGSNVYMFHVEAKPFNRELGTLTKTKFMSNGIACAPMMQAAEITLRGNVESYDIDCGNLNSYVVRWFVEG